MTEVPHPPKKSEPRDPQSSLRVASSFLFLAILILLAWLHHPQGGWNVNTRLALVYSVVEAQTFQIDAFHDTPPYATGDKALFEGHYYSDKIFGVSFLAIPFYWIASLLLESGALDYHWSYYFSKFGAVALPGAIGATLFFLILARLGAPPKRAVLLTIMAVMGTMWFGYGTIFFPYMPAMAAMLGALYLTLFPKSRRLHFGNCFSVGLLLGYSLLCEVTTGLAVFGIGVIWLLRLLDQGGFLGQRAFAEMAGDRSTGKQLVPLAISFWVGVLISAALFVIYTLSIFGEVVMPYKYEANKLFAEGMSEGFFGIGAPDLSVLYYITVHPFRGLFFWSPIMIAAGIGCVLGAFHYGKRFLLGWLGIYMLFAYLLFNAGYYMWWGGWCMGPRFLIPMLPFTLLGLGELARHDRLSIFNDRPKLAAASWWTVVGLGILSIMLSAPLSMTDPQTPQGSTPTESLLNAEFAEDQPEVTQFAYLQSFYSGHITVWPLTRLKGVIGSEDATMSNVLSILVYLLIIGLLVGIAWWMAPVKLSGTERSDYPLKTIDGAAAPPPPPMFKAR